MPVNTADVILVSKFDLVATINHSGRFRKARLGGIVRYKINKWFSGNDKVLSNTTGKSLNSQSSSYFTM